jgi:hypothetical protein
MSTCIGLEEYKGELEHFCETFTRDQLCEYFDTYFQQGLMANKKNIIQFQINFKAFLLAKITQEENPLIQWQKKKEKNEQQKEQEKKDIALITHHINFIYSAGQEYLAHLEKDILRFYGNPAYTKMSQIPQEKLSEKCKENALLNSTVYKYNYVFGFNERLLNQKKKAKGKDMLLDALYDYKELDEWQLSGNRDTSTIRFLKSVKSAFLSLYYYLGTHQTWQEARDQAREEVYITQGTLFANSTRTYINDVLDKSEAPKLR